MGQQQEKTVAEVLEAAASLIEPEGAWTQGAYYRDANGREIYADRREAACFCALGAIRIAGDYDASGLPDLNPAAQVLEGVLDTGVGIHEWNDAPGRTQAEVVAKLREAAAVARERGL